MMYETCLQSLLDPLGIYDFSDGSLNGAELASLGTALDLVFQQLVLAERESIVTTAENEGLSRREALFARSPAANSPIDRRVAIAALMQISSDSFTPAAIDLTLSGCGIRAWAYEMGNGVIRIVFPDVTGEPDEYERIKQIILDIIPCHLDVEFYLRYMTWYDCENCGYTWAGVESKNYSWDAFLSSVPSMTSKEDIFAIWYP